MKTQFVFLVVCVIAAFALPGRRSVDDNNSEVNNQQIEILDDNQGSANTSDESIENPGQNSISSNETTTEKNRSDCIWRRRNENKRRWLKYGGGRSRNSTDLNNDERMHPFIHTSIWQEKQNGPIHGGDNSDSETRLHRHHHHRHHHHHHHKNRTTTTPPPTTTTAPSAQLSGMEE